MEPVWMTLGESAVVAAPLALEKDCSVRQNDCTTLHTKLLARGIMLDLATAAQLG